jgi:hypothetical protein
MNIKNIKKNVEWKMKSKGEKETIQDQINKEYLHNRTVKSDYSNRYFFWRGKGMSHTDAEKKAIQEQKELHIID